MSGQVRTDLVQEDLRGCVWWGRGGEGRSAKTGPESRGKTSGDDMLERRWAFSDTLGSSLLTEQSTLIQAGLG